MYEVDYLWAGEKVKAGDAIAMRFTNPATGFPVVVIIDGGFIETGARLVAHVREHYHTDVVDLVVCTHPDADHIGGLTDVIANLNVTTLLIHQPSRYGYRPADNVKSDTVDDLIALARRRGTSVDTDAHAGRTYFGGAFLVAGPTETYYRELLAQQADRTAQAIAALRHMLAESPSTAAVRASRTVYGDPGETLTDDNGGTSACNNTSIIVDLQVDGVRVLFTGDAGAPALEQAQVQLEASGRANRRIDVFDVPHHGSRHNVTADLLDRILGTKTDDWRGHAIASVGAQADDHPRPEVANALKRRGYPVSCTRGTSLWWRSPDAPSRWSYGTNVTPLDWLEEGE